MAGVLLVLFLLAVAGGLSWVVITSATSSGRVSRNEVPLTAVPVTPVGPLSDGTASGGARDSLGGLGAWIERVAPATGLSATALRAYGNAELVLRGERPDCRLSWATVAGIGLVESNHGRFGGAVFDVDGRVSPPILGPPLDGSPGRMTIVDSDRGRLDGDATFDRAVGPLQFLPETWRRFAADATGDGVADPQNIIDAAVATGRYLCARGRDLTTGEDWWAAVLTYNDSLDYARDVFDAANDYARASTGGG